MKLVVCNTEWATGKKKKLLNEIIFDYSPDIVCATEVKKDFFLKEGNIIFSESNYGYNTVDKYKVSLWSKKPWTAINETLPHAPSGRFLSACTEADSALINIIGVCIPWKSAHVSTGMKNKKIWEDHVAYIDALNEYLASDTHSKQIVCGDMNQRIPIAKQPELVFNKLTNLLRNHKIITTGIIPKIETVSIDHVAVKRFDVKEMFGVSKIQDGIELTDHDLIFCELI